MARQGKFCPHCEERVNRRSVPFGRIGWASEVEESRRAHQHRDGSPLCAEMTSTGYQPALPVRSI